jgi:hypothetical protein
MRKGKLKTPEENHMSMPRCMWCAKILCLFLVCGTFASAAAEGMLTVKTEPEGIEVWLNDKFLGQSPIIDKKIKAGRYTLKLVDAVQHSSTTEDVQIQDNETTVVERTITSKFGSLRITTDPPDAEVSIATELGKTPISNDFMNPGRYRLEIKSPDSRHLPAVTEVTIAKGEVVSIDEKLKTKQFLTRKNIASLCLTAGTAGGFVWGLVEQGNYKMYKERKNQAKADGAALQRTLGIIVGSACLVGLEIVALF